MVLHAGIVSKNTELVKSSTPTPTPVSNEIGHPERLAMALSGKKRFREKSIQNPTKRQSLEAEFTRPSKQQNAGKKVVSLNELAWKEVTLPDRFDDAEGFFGLEEIEDVDVVRDTKGGNVEYRVGEIPRKTSVGILEF